MGDEIKLKLGPLASLVGTWEGNKGDDLAPSDDRGTENNKFRERMVFQPFGPTMNHEQALYGLSYKTNAFRLGETDAFHEELGYWLWDAKEHQVMKCFLVPRGVTVLAGGPADPDSRKFELFAEVGSPTYGICSNLFLNREFKTLRYELRANFLSDGSFSYFEDTQIQIRGKDQIFHHTDQNTLKLV